MDDQNNILWKLCDFHQCLWAVRYRMTDLNPEIQTRGGRTAAHKKRDSSWINILNGISFFSTFNIMSVARKCSHKNKEFVFVFSNKKSGTV